MTATQNGRPVTFFAPGRPSPQGSKRFVGNGVMLDVDTSLKSWRSVVAAACPIKTPLFALIDLELVFCYNRPRTHYGKRNKKPYLRDDAPYYKNSAPDLDKLTRAVCDALTGVAFVDDRLIVRLVASKIYTQATAGVNVTITPLDPHA